MTNHEAWCEQFDLPKTTPKCGAIFPDLFEVTCRLPKGHEHASQNATNVHRDGAIEWTDEIPDTNSPLKLITVTTDRQSSKPNRPTQMPAVKNGECVIALYDQGLGEKLIVCRSLDDMQKLYDSYYRGGAIKLEWYSAPVVFLETCPNAKNN
ncbi:MAG: hypothetical protein Q7S86_04150 [bacterium]|nr:hypothetical protein [bacterium]